MLTLYSMPSSGNSYKVRLLLAKLGIPYRHIDCEYGSGVTRTPEFLAKNPNGRAPLLELEDGRLLSEAKAILLFLGEGTRFVPDDKFTRAKVHQWMFWEQNTHEATVAVRAAILTYPHRAQENRPEVTGPLLESGHRALGVMEVQLEKTPFLVGDDLTAADVCLYGYTHTAGKKGGFEMNRFPAINAWLERVAADAPHVRLEDIPE